MIPFLKNLNKPSFSLPIKVCILGSSGSIGTQALEVIRNNEDIFKVSGLSVHSNLELLEKQIKEFLPLSVSVKSEDDYKKILPICREYAPDCKIYYGEYSLLELTSDKDHDIVLNALLGFAGLPPLLSAINSSKPIALANKESIVAGSALINEALGKNPVPLIPVDSEHNALYQAIKSRKDEKPRKLFITASGGPFLNHSKEQLLNITPEQAATHPRWSMGKKISIDSATLMNKALELIEASMLFEYKENDIEVIIHPQSFFHGFVEYADGSLIATCYEPDMKIPILNALCECSGIISRMDSSQFSNFSTRTFSASNTPWFSANKSMNFEFIPLDNEQFPAVSLSREALSLGGSAPLAFNSANEIAVNHFIDGKIRFCDIISVVNEVMNSHQVSLLDSFDKVIEIDKEIRLLTSELCSKMN